MVRVELWAPEETPISDQVMVNALSLVGVRVPRIECVYPWSAFERLLAYDWAMRIHVHASDGGNRMRPRPSFVLRAWGGEGA